MQRTALQSAKRMGIRFVFLSLLLALLAVVSIAQTTQQFTGRVLDSAGAAIPNAEVVVHNNATGIDAKTFTTEQGIYTVPYLKPGNYNIVVSKHGFKAEEKTDILLNVGQTSTIDFHMSVGAVSEVVTVVANNSQIELTKGDRGEIIDGERIAEMPLDSRNPFGLFALSPGTHDFSNPLYPRPFDDVTDNMYANGSPQQGSTNIDGLTNDAGGDNTAGFRTNTGLVPSVDVVQEFKVVLNAYDASYGRAGGSSIDLALKSGGNQFHGVVDYYMRRKWLDATLWQAKYNNPTNPVKPDHKRDQYSFELGGPVVIPHLFNGKNKLFFVASYEQMNEILPKLGYNTFSLPDPAWLTGDFSNAMYWNSRTGSLQPLLIYDPLTPLQTVVDPNDGKTKQAHAQFPGNRIPASRIDPVGLNLLGYLMQVYKDQPGQIVNPGPGFAPYTNNYQNLEVEHDTWRNALFKVDYNVSDYDKLSFRWGAQGRWSNTNSNTGLSNSNPANMNGHGAQPASQTGSAQWTHTFSPNLLLNVGASLMTQKNRNYQGPRFDNSFLTSLGFSSAFTSQLQFTNYFPYISPGAPANAAGYVTMAHTAPTNGWFEHTLGILPTVTYIHGAHTIRAGLDVRLQQWDNPVGGGNNRFDFSNGWTSRFGPGFGDATNYVSGSSIAALLLGYPNGGSVPYNLHSFYSQHYFAPWVQDDWKLTKKLTLNLGLRWDFLMPRVERFSRNTGVFNTTVVNPVSSQIPTGTAALGTSTRLVGGLEFAGMNGQPPYAFRLNKFDIQPRFGFAYAITPRMVIRGGFGETYFNDWSEDPTYGFSSSTGYTNSLDSGLTPYTATTGQGLSNPIPTVQKPTGFSLGYQQNLGSGLSFWNPKYEIPSLWSYSLTHEVGLTRRDVVSVSYVGNRTTNNRVDDNSNRISPAWNAQCDLERGGNRHICDDTATGQIANPFKGIAAFAGTGYYSSNTLSKSNFTRPYPEFGDITEFGAYNKARNWYNSLQVTAKHEFANNLTFHATYTHAKAMTAGSFLDNVNRIVARQVSTTNDVKHAVTLSGVMYLPFGRNRMLFSKVSRWVDTVINGWEFSPLYTYYSGFGWRPRGNWEFVGDTASMGVPQTILPPDSSHKFSRLRGATPCVGTRDTDTGAIIPGPAAIAAGCTTIQWVTAPNGYAVARRNIDFGVRQPGGHNFDAAISKNFKVPEASKLHLSEAANLQLRIDFLNVLNHPNWDFGYNDDPKSLDFGTISKGPSGPRNSPRYMQLSARLNW